VPKLSGGWQHNHLTETRQAGHANEQSIYSLLSTISINATSSITKTNCSYAECRLSDSCYAECRFYWSSLCRVSLYWMSWRHLQTDFHLQVPINISFLQFWKKMHKILNLSSLGQGILTEMEGSIHLTSSLG
jgi:hypothetical protein